MKERIASSYSGLHFGYYKAHALYLGIARIKCRLVNIVVRNGLPLKRWTKGVSVILEKSSSNMNM